MNNFYRYGTIVMADFGENRGCEFNGLHFAITIDKKDNIHSKTITVIPLTSKNKKNKHIHIDYSVIHSIIQSAVSEVLKLIMIKRLMRFIEKKHKLYTPVHIYDEVFIDYVLSKNKLLLKANDKLLNKWLEEDYQRYKEVTEYYKKYNKKSYARLDSIRNIDKSRILPKINSLDPINSAVLPIEYQNKIKKELKKKYC